MKNIYPNLYYAKVEEITIQDTNKKQNKTTNIRCRQHTNRLL